VTPKISSRVESQAEDETVVEIIINDELAGVVSFKTKGIVEEIDRLGWYLCRVAAELKGTKVD
jgi:hypothetical protein